MDKERVESLDEQQARVVPPLTESGYELAKVPKQLWQSLRRDFRSHRDQAREEPPHGKIRTACKDRHPSLLYEDRERNVKLLNRLTELHERWCGLVLLPSICYGMRVYQRGSFLLEHVDWIATHVISSIVNIDQRVDRPWPLFIRAYGETAERIILEPGDMLFYESARLLHGRPEPLEGEYYCNIFLHYRPVNWNLTSDRVPKEA